MKSVAALLTGRVAMFEFGVVCEVFGLDRADDGVPNFAFRVCGKQPGAPLLSSTPGVTVTPEFGLEELASADLVAVPAATIRDGFDPAVVDALAGAAAAGATILTVCSGAFLAGAAGLLDNRRCTTHWRYADELARQYPTARVDRDVLFVDDGEVITSAGTAAGIDACLHLVRRELGASIANIIARRMVVPPQRDGGQRQYIEQPIPSCQSDSLAELLDWLTENLTEQHTIDTMADRAMMSNRTFARRFSSETGTTPVKWLTAQRVLAAKRLLEDSDIAVERVAEETGFASATLLRHHFVRAVGIAPVEYRKRFGATG